MIVVSGYMTYESEEKKKRVQRHLGIPSINNVFS